MKATYLGMTHCYLVLYGVIYQKQKTKYGKNLSNVKTIQNKVLPLCIFSIWLYIVSCTVFTVAATDNFGTRFEQNIESTFMQAASDVADIGEGTFDLSENMLESSSSLQNTKTSFNVFSLMYG